MQIYTITSQKGACKVTRMSETVADRIRQRLAALGKTAHAASVEGGNSPSLIPNILGGRSENPRIDTLRKIAASLETTAEWLMTGGEPPQLPAAVPLPDKSELRHTDIPAPTAAGLPKDVPVLGTAAGSELGNGAFQLTTDVIDYVRRPAGLAGARDAYALYVEGDSMAPRFEPGDLVFIHPHRKPQPGDYVIIQEADSNNGEPRAFIKRLVKITGTTIRVTQFNPASTIDFMIRRGTVVHKVITDGDLYGI